MTKKRLYDKHTRHVINTLGETRTPLGVILEGNVHPGLHHGFATLGWTHTRENTWPLVILNMALFRNIDSNPVGKMNLVLPFSPGTERYVSTVVEACGWDGRIWPYKDHGWPEGSEHEEDFLWILKEIGLGSTMTFPVDREEGIPAIPIHVAKRHGPFRTAPYIEDPRPVKYLQHLRELATDPTLFSSDWTPPETAKPVR